MKLKEFNIQNTFTNRMSNPAIGVNTKTGLFNINDAAVELMGLKGNDQIVLHQDQDDPQCWYLEKVKKDGWTIREKDNVTKGLLFNNAALARALAAGLGKEETGFRVLIAGEATTFQKRTLWGLLSAPNKN